MWVSAEKLRGWAYPITVVAMGLALSASPFWCSFSWANMGLQGAVGANLEPLVTSEAERPGVTGPGDLGVCADVAPGFRTSS